MSSPKSAPKAKWDLKKDSCLVELLLTYTRAGEKSDSGFKAKVGNAIAAAFGKKWPRLKPKQLQCRTILEPSFNSVVSHLCFTSLTIYILDPHVLCDFISKAFGLTFLFLRNIFVDWRNLN